MTTRAPVPPALRGQVDRIRRSAQPAVRFALLSAQVRVRDPNGRSGMTTGGRFRPVRVWRRGYGTADERAALLCMIARGAGFRCRVVRLGTSAHAVPSGTPHAWPEVHFEDAGWIAFPADTAVASPTHADVRAWAELGARGRVIEVARAISRSTWWALLVAAGGIAAIGALAVAAAGVVAGLVARPVRRSLRRHRSRQDERIAGAWREVTDLLRLRGAASTAACSVAEVVAVARALDGDAAARGVAALGQVAERAWFGRSAPGPADAERAWDWEREVRAELIAAAPAWRRPLLAVDPRPVVWDLADAWSRVTARRRPFARPAGRTRRGRHRVRVAPS